MHRRASLPHPPLGGEPPATHPPIDGPWITGPQAARVADHRGQRGPGTGWLIMAEPEGNQFCVLTSRAEHAEPAEIPVADWPALTPTLDVRDRSPQAPR